MILRRHVGIAAELFPPRCAPYHTGCGAARSSSALKRAADCRPDAMTLNALR